MNWKQLQGQIVDGEFQLLEHLGGKEDSATYLAGAPGAAKAAVKLVTAVGRNTGELLARWKISESLSHSHLLRVFRSGVCELSGTELLFVAMEYAEENLAQVLPQRALTPDEVREMLPPLLDTLEYLHSQQLVHGNLKPGSVMASGDQLKLSSDTILRIGESLKDDTLYSAPEAETGVLPASDLWSLGVTLVEVLTQHTPIWEPGNTLAQLPDNMPEQFRVIAQRCLIPDPALRGTLDDIREKIKPAPVVQPAPAVAAKPKEKLWRSPKVLIPATAALAVGVFLAIPNNTETPAQPEKEATESTTQTQAPPPVPSSPPAVLTEATNPVPRPREPVTEKPQPQRMEVLVPVTSAAVAPPAKPSQQAAARNVSVTPSRNDAVLREVLPEVPRKAMNTINGKFRVQVKVRVDREGNVVASEFISRGPSRYFADLTMQAAKQWKFIPAESADRTWDLDFEFRRSGILSMPRQINR